MISKYFYYTRLLYNKYMTVKCEAKAQNHYLLWIPPGFAHGFQALEDSLVVYLVTKEYSPQHERCIKWDDPEIGVQWPIKEVLVSERDKACPPLKEAETNFGYPV